MLKLNHKIILGILMTLLFVPQAFAITATDIPSGGSDTVILDGVKIKKGTIAAFILNVKNLEKILVENTNSQEISNIKNDIRANIEPLKVTKIFEDIIPMRVLLEAKRDNGEIHQSKVLVACLYLQKYREELTPSLQAKLKELTPHLSPMIKEEAIPLLK